ncbi:hypothetical protein [Luteitalea sp.]|uniref:hypothetical protein n=1 Tax=Luteitalea sp. TaxID=2004800 RepID=UPI0025B8E27A|nr:hypothetical protein [Luteitalea sp.]
MTSRLVLLLWFGLFCGLAVAFSWPLPLHLATHLTGAPSGDTGVYVWNLWVFRHEVLHQQMPLQTGTVLSLSPRVDLTLHNYTLFMDILAYPLIGPLGLVRAFNVVYLAMMALTAWCTARLAWALCGRHWESWLAGVAFAFSPVLMARSTAHFSLVAAAPLSVLLLIMVKAEGKGRARDAVAAGATLAWAAFCDIYYAVYGVLLIGAWILASVVSVSRADRLEGSSAFARRVTRGLVIVAATFVAAIALQGGLVQVAGLRISMRSLYTPMLVLTLLVVLHALVVWTPKIEWRYRFAPWHAWFAAVMVVTAATLLSPVLMTYGQRLLQGRMAGPAIYWRSSPPGVDLLAFVMPNPTSPWFGGPFKAWIEAQRVDGFAELTGALPLVALAVIGVAWVWAGWRPARRRWLWMPAVFAMLALGPFVHVAGINTHIPGPWALLRYVPIVGLARSPSRFVVLVALGVALLFAMALVAIGQRWPHRRRLVLGVLTAVLLVELAPVPRTLYDARTPQVFHRIAADPREDVRVLSLPFGVRDGTSSLGDFNPLTQYQQTTHGKRLVGGYLSRVTREQKQSMLRFPVLDSLMTLSAPGPATSLTEHQRRRAFASRDRFMLAANLAYVVTDDRRTSPALRAYAIELFRLEALESGEGYTLYAPHPDADAIQQAFMAPPLTPLPESSSRGGQAARRAP